MNQFNYVGKAKIYHRIAVWTLWSYIILAIGLLLLPILTFFFNWGFNVEPAVLLTTVPMLGIVVWSCCLRDVNQKEYMTIMKALKS